MTALSLPSRAIALAASTALCLVLCLSGCEANLAPQTIEVGLADHPPSAGQVEGGWQSVGWLGDVWLRYPGRSSIVMEHGLEREPSTVLVYLSFDEDGAGSALTAGDTARIVSADERFVTIRNDSDADFFVRIVVR